MNLLELMLDETFWYEQAIRLSITLLHFLWQGVLVGLVAAVALQFCKQKSANFRYTLVCGAFFCLPLLAIATFAITEAPTKISSIATRENVADGAEMMSFAPSDLQAKVDALEGSALPDHGAKDTNVAGMDSGVSNSITAESVGPKNAESASAIEVIYPFLPFVAACYIAGVLLMLLRLQLRIWRGAKLCSRSPEATDQALLALMKKLSRQAGLKWVPVIRYCDRVVVPTVVGILKPVVLMPASLLSQLTTDEITAILNHELAHIRRFDSIVQVAQKTVEAMLFFHPVAWWLSRQINDEREDCCDDWAASVMDSIYRNVDYASALLKVAELCLAGQPSRLASTTTALSVDGANANQLSRRIERVLKVQSSPHVASTRLLSLSASLVFGLCVTCITVVSVSSDDMNKEPNPMSSESSIQVAVDAFNQKVKRQERGAQQPPLTAEEVLTAIKSFDREEDGRDVNDQEVASFRAVTSLGELPETARFEVYTGRHSGPYVIERTWDIRLLIPAIGHDGFVRFKIRDTKLEDETINPEDVAWGDPDEDGLELGIYLSPKKSTYQLGERVRMRLLVRNQGDQPVKTAWANTTHPMPSDFTVTDASGSRVPVFCSSEDNWTLPWISGFRAGGIASGDTHALYVPYEIRIGLNGIQPKRKYYDETNDLVGRAIDAQAGQQLKVQIQASNGNYQTEKSTIQKSGSLTFNVSAPMSGIEAKPNPTVGTELPNDSGNQGSDEGKIPLADVVWWDAGDGLEAGFLLDTPTKPNRRIAENSIATYQILVRNKSREEIEFLARLLPHEKRDAPFLVPADDINAELKAAELSAKFRAVEGPAHSIEPAYLIKLVPGESAIIRSQRAQNMLAIFVGDRKPDQTVARAKTIKAGMNWIVQPLQIHRSIPAGGTGLMGQAYQLSKVDKDGNVRNEMAVRRGAEPGGELFYPRIQLEMGTLNSNAVFNARLAAWGEVDKGLQCGIRLLDAKASYEVSDILEAEFLWRNVSDQPIWTPIPGRLDLYPQVFDSDGRDQRIDFGARFNIYPISQELSLGEVRSLGAFKIRLVSPDAKSPKSNADPAHILLKPGKYSIGGSGGVSGADTGAPRAGKVDFVVASAANEKSVSRDKTETFDHHAINLSGQTMDATGNPIKGSKVFLVSTYTPKAKDEYRVFAETTSDAEGRYEFRNTPLPVGPLEDWGPESRRGGFAIYALAEGHGLAWRPEKNVYTDSIKPQPGLKPESDGTPDFFDSTDEKIEIDLNFSKSVTMKGRVTDPSGKPLAGVQVDWTTCTKLREAQPPLGSDELHALFQGAVAKSVTRRITDSDGQFVFADLPHTAQLHFIASKKGYASEHISAAALSNPALYATKPLVTDGNLDFRMRQIQEVTVQVLLADTKQPAAKVLISARGNGTGDSVTTDDQGRGTLELPEGEYDNIILYPRIGTDYLRTEESQNLIVAKGTENGSSKVSATFEIQPASKLEITVVDAKTGKPIPDVKLEVDDSEHGWRWWEVETNVSHWIEPISGPMGKMSALVSPGKHKIGIRAMNLEYKYRIGDAKVELDCPASQSQPVIIKVKPVESDGAQ